MGGGKGRGGGGEGMVLGDDVGVAGELGGHFFLWLIEGGIGLGSVGLG